MDNNDIDADVLGTYLRKPDQEEDQEEDQDQEEEENTPCLSIVDSVCGNSDWTSFCSYLQQLSTSDVDFANRLEDIDNQFTVFVPNDAAWNLVDLAIEAGLKEGKVNRIINFHMYENVMLSYDELQCNEAIMSLSDGDTSSTKCDKSYTFTRSPSTSSLQRKFGSGSTVKYQNGNGNTKLGLLPKIISKDLLACNGIIHGIDHVMMPVVLVKIAEISPSPTSAPPTTTTAVDVVTDAVAVAVAEPAVADVVADAVPDATPDAAVDVPDADPAVADAVADAVPDAATPDAAVPDTAVDVPVDVPDADPAVADAVADAVPNAPDAAVDVPVNVADAISDAPTVDASLPDTDMDVPVDVADAISDAPTLDASLPDTDVDVPVDVADAISDAPTLDASLPVVDETTITIDSNSSEADREGDEEVDYCSMNGCIHKSCYETKYYEEGYCGAAWYCSDHETYILGEDEEEDNSCIREGCTNDDGIVWDNDLQGWRCSYTRYRDCSMNACVHKDCYETAYYEEGYCGAAWYCSDHETYVYGVDEVENVFCIREGCSDEDGIRWDDGLQGWMCSN